MPPVPPPPSPAAGVFPGVSTHGFKGNLASYGDSVLTDQIESSLHGWLTWSLLGVGAFENVELASARSRLRPANDPRYVANTVWQAGRSDWVWESGVEHATQPIRVSGVWVNDVFHPTAATGTYAHRVNYPLGQVVFSGAVPATSVVKVEHSPRFVQVRRADEPWFHAVAYRSFLSDDPQFETPSASGGGGWATLAENRVQLPVVVVEPAFGVGFEPLEIGNGAGTYSENWLLHVLAETPWDRKKLHDILAKQVEKRVPTFDRDGVAMPLDAYGRPVASAMVYPDMCEAAPWHQLRVAEVTSVGQRPVGRHLYSATVRFRVEVDTP